MPEGGAGSMDRREMQAAVWRGGRLSVEPAPVPPRLPGEALVRVVAAGICNTDLEITRGYMGFEGIPGHEFVGVVEQADDPGWVGRRVVGEINLPCGRCSTCAAGLGKHCPDIRTLGIHRKDGAFAEYLTLPLANLHAVPDGVTDEEAVLVEPLAAALQVLEQVAVRPTDRVVVLGDGKLGLLTAMALHAYGHRPLLVGRHPGKLAVARAAGIDTALTPAEGVLAPRSADVVVECTGNASGLGDALEWVRPRGTVVLKSTVAHGAPINLTPVAVREITVVGSRCGPFEPALRLLSEGRVPARSLISAVYPLAEAVQAFEAARQPGVLKVLLRMPGHPRLARSDGPAPQAVSSG